MKEINKEFDAKMGKTIEVVKERLCFGTCRPRQSRSAGQDHRGLLRLSHPAQPGGRHFYSRPPRSDDPALGRQYSEGDREGHPDL